MNSSIEFYSKNSHFLINGIISQTLVYENQKSQEAKAKENIAQILSIKNSNIILIGAEHLLSFDQLNITNNQIIIIEKNPLKLDFYQKKLAGLSNNIICLSSSFGLFTPFNTIGPGLVEDEAIDILMRLSKLDIDWGKPNLYFTIYQNPNEEPLNKTLHENIGFVLDAKKFHSTQNNAYQKYKALKLTHEKTGILVNEASDVIFLQRFKIPHYDNHDTLILEEVLKNSPITENDLGYINKKSSFFAQKSTLILNWILSQELTILTFKNQSVFLELGDLLFFGEMFDQINIELFPLFPDWFHQQTSTTSTGGKFFYPFYNNLKRQIKVGTIYPHEGACFKPSNALVYNVPFSYRNPQINLLQPLADPDLCTLDIAVLHHSRLRGMQVNEINELFEIAMALGANHNEKDAFDIIHILHQEIDKESYPLNSYTAKNTLQVLDFFFYVQIRIRWVILLINNFANKHSVKIYGKDWDKLIQLKYVGPSTQSTQDLQKIYQESFVTLDFNPMYSTYPHSLNMIDAFISGGLCLHLTPLYFDIEGENFFKRDSLFYFSSMSELQNRLEFLFNNKSKRAGFIIEAQKMILDKGLDSFYPKKMEPLSKAIQLPVSNQNPILIDIAKGYLLLLLGCPALAFNKFQNALIALDYSHVPLIIRAVKTRLICGEKEKALNILKKGFERHPTSEILLTYLNSIKSELVK